MKPQAAELPNVSGYFWIQIHRCNWQRDIGFSWDLPPIIEPWQIACIIPDIGHAYSIEVVGSDEGVESNHSHYVIAKIIGPLALPEEV